MAYHWRCPASMFQSLLEAGANPDTFQFQLVHMVERAERLDAWDGSLRYRNWVNEHGAEVETLCMSTALADHLNCVTEPAAKKCARRVNRL